MRWVAAAALVLAVSWLIGVPIASGAPPAAEPYRRELTREARLQFGLDAPIAVMAAQVEQESAWNPTAQSAFARGLAQFTPSTATWISGAYPATLSLNEPFNPAWALRALAQYDRVLYDGFPVPLECDRWAMVLAGYNGGPGWVQRDRRICGAVGGCDPDKWFAHVERFTNRSPEAMRENRNYPRRILLKLQSGYVLWGRAVSC